MQSKKRSFSILSKIAEGISTRSLELLQLLSRQAVKLGWKGKKNDGRSHPGLDLQFMALTSKGNFTFVGCAYWPTSSPKIHSSSLLLRVHQEVHQIVSLHSNERWRRKSMLLVATAKHNCRNRCGLGSTNSRPEQCSAARNSEFIMVAV